ncbi:MAG TPA: hypothetical protein VI386_38090 [Candidatus Sulfotelmatobacter sp.]
MSTLLGGASRQTYASTFPPDSFYCLLDELPVHLIPQGFVTNFFQEDQTIPLFLNSDCEFLSAKHWPAELTARPELVTKFAMQGTMAWVRHSVSQYPLPFWLSSQMDSQIRSLRPHQNARQILSTGDCAALAAAGVLRRADDAILWQICPDRLNMAAKEYCEKGYVAFPGLLHPFHVAALRRYYRGLIRTGRLTLGDFQSPRRYVAYNEPVARFFHHYLTQIVGVVAREAVKPSYAYVASYLRGAELKRHTDREQCEFSVSLCLDFSPEPAGRTVWPLCLDTPDGLVKVHQALGDALFYRGTRIPHYREALPYGLTSTSIFFHYVPASFTGPLN